MSTTTAAPTTTWTETTLKETLVDILVPYLGTTREELTARGPGMPIDSLDLFDVLPDFWKVTGLKVPTKELRRRTMRSVDAFVAYVAERGEA
jgi:acyl carrier protein